MVKKIMKSLFLTLFLLLSGQVVADQNKATIITMTEQEGEMEAYRVRMLFTNQLIRFDDNADESNYVIYDDSTRNIFSVNHDDKTVLVMKYEPWSLPEFKFTRNERWKKITDAPLINGKQVHTFWLAAGEEICTEAQVGEGFLLKEAALMRRYKETLSAEQVKSIVATPEDMRTPCLLVDQVYNNGALYSRGFPVQQWHKSGIKRFMDGYKTGQKISSKLFEIPADYKRYSMGDNLSFGE